MSTTLLKVIGVMLDPALSLAFDVQPDETVSQVADDFKDVLLLPFNEKFKPSTPAQLSNIQVFASEPICPLLKISSAR
jgi:hypothetical protein